MVRVDNIDDLHDLLDSLITPELEADIQRNLGKGPPKRWCGGC